MSKSWHLFVWLALLPPLAWIGHGLLFTSFMIYDDEGYILHSLTNQIEHGGLYEKVYSQYGPFFYAALGTLSRALDFEWNHVSGRWFTLFNWLAASGLCGLCVWRNERKWSAPLFTAVTVFSLLWMMILEPVHPGGLITMLLALTTVIGAECIEKQKPWMFALWIGALGALIALVKINAGAFLVIAGGLWLLATTQGRLRRAMLALGAIVSVSLPYLLMRVLMHMSWVPVYALLVALSTLAVFIVVSEHGRGTSSPRHLLWFVGAGLGVTVLVGIWAVTQGTSPMGLLHGVLLAPLKHPDVYSFPVKWRPFVLPSAVIGLVITLAWAFRPRAPVVLHLIAAARVLVATITAYAILPWSGSSVASLALCYGVPAAALFAIPLRAATASGSSLVRPWLALLFCLQSMQAYPIAGSQLGWGTFLWIPLMTLGLYDAVHFWSDRSRASRAIALRLALISAILCLAGIQVHHHTRVLDARLTASTPLGLAQASNLKLLPPLASALHVMVVNARENGHTLFSLPGTFSFNLWADRPTPTLKNVTHWFSLLTEDEQREIIASIEADPKAALVVHRPLIEFLHEKGFPVSGPLVSYLHSAFKPVVSVDGIALWVKRDRSDVVLFMIAESEATSHGARVSVNLPPTHEPIARLEATYYEDHYFTQTQAGSHVGPRSLNPRIRSLAPSESEGLAETPLVWPLAPGPARQMTFDFPADLDAAQRHKWIFRFAAEDGRTLGFARFPR